MLAGSQSGYRDCEITINSEELGSPYRAICTDAATGIIIGCSSIGSAPNKDPSTISAEDVLRMIGGTYRLASIAIEIEIDELARRSRRISDQLRSRRRLWRRRSRLRSNATYSVSLIRRYEACWHFRRFPLLLSAPCAPGKANFAQPMCQAACDKSTKST